MNRTVKYFIELVVHKDAGFSYVGKLHEIEQMEWLKYISQTEPVHSVIPSTATPTAQRASVEKHSCSLEITSPVIHETISIFISIYSEIYTGTLP